jgi:outer membrane protein TolC
VTAPAVLALAFVLQQPEPISLRQAVERAAARAPAVTLALLRGESAVERTRQARAALLPSIGASAGWLNRSFNRAALGFSLPAVPGQPDRIGPFDNVDARIRVTQALFDWAAVARMQAARAQRTGVDAEAAVAAEVSAHAAALAYLRAGRAHAQLAARIADTALAQDLVRLAEAQVEAGVAQVIDGTRARTQLVAARGAVIVAQADRQRATLDLARAVDADVAAILVPSDTLGPEIAAAPVPHDADSAAALALTVRPDVAAEAARLAAARRSVAAVTAERLPRLELALDYGLNGPSPDSVIGTGQIGVQVTLPLFDGLRREARAAEQRVAARESTVRLQDLARQVRADVTAALVDLRAADARLAIALERWRLGEAELDQARERFAAGVAGNIEVITAQIGLLDARDGVIDARFAAAAARVALARAAGVTRRLQ